MKTFRINIKSKLKDFKVSDKVKVYYYKDSNGKEVVIGQQDKMDKFHIGKSVDECDIRPYFRWTKFRKRKRTVHIFSLKAKKEELDGHINDMMSRVKGYAYKVIEESTQTNVCH